MSATTDNSTKNVEALLKEARAVKRTANAYSKLNRSQPASSKASVTADAVSRQIVLAYLGGGK